MYYLFIMTINIVLSYWFEPFERKYKPRDRMKEIRGIPDVDRHVAASMFKNTTLVVTDEDVYLSHLVDLKCHVICCFHTM